MIYPIKTTRHGKKQENTVHNEWVNQLIKPCEQLTQMLELGEKDLKIRIIIIAFPMFRKLEETWKT